MNRGIVLFGICGLALLLDRQARAMNEDDHNSLNLNLHALPPVSEDRVKNMNEDDHNSLNLNLHALPPVSNRAYA